MTTNAPKTMRIDDVEYVRADSVDVRPAGNRKLIVSDRAYIYAGDVEVKTENGNCIYVLTRAVNLFRFNSIGLDGAIANPKSDKVTIKKMPVPVEIPFGSILHMFPVSDDWGL